MKKKLMPWSWVKKFNFWTTFSWTQIGTLRNDDHINIIWKNSLQFGWDIITICVHLQILQMLQPLLQNA